METGSVLYEGINRIEQEEVTPKGQGVNEA